MQLQMTSPVIPSSAQSLVSLARIDAQPFTAMPLAMGDTFTRGSTGDKIKGAVVVGGIGLLGAAVGAYAGLNTGLLAGVAGTVAGAAGGVSLSMLTKDQNVKLGLVGGAIAGALLGASVAHPVLGAVMGIAGATLPYAAILVIFSGIE